MVRLGLLTERVAADPVEPSRPERSCRSEPTTNSREYDPPSSRGTVMCVTTNRLIRRCQRSTAYFGSDHWVEHLAEPFRPQTH